MDPRTRNYRDELYRLRSHPTELPPEFADSRDSFLKVYLSVIPFLGLEYFAESRFDAIPSGIIFPLGFLLMWAFYYSYYKPNVLENHLSNVSPDDIGSIPMILFGTLVWVVKKILFGSIQWIFGIRTREIRLSKRTLRERRQLYRGQNLHWQTQQKSADYNAAYHEPGRALPRELVHALSVLGLPPDADWNAIHKRYRSLAKQYHPDLNKDITDIGRRFMMFDSAYRRLAAAKGYFKN